MNEIALSILKRANAVGVSISELFRKADVNRSWFELIKRRIPRSVSNYEKIDKVLKQLEDGRV